MKVAEGVPTVALSVEPTLRVIVPRLSVRPHVPLAVRVIEDRPGLRVVLATVCALAAAAPTKVSVPLPAMEAAESPKTSGVDAGRTLVSVLDAPKASWRLLISWGKVPEPTLPAVIVVEPVY